ncbi:MAG: hypothetical protein KKI08_19555 [Armatimonadetes bacterium]|nr:hypothetical protein [Armatimonadota bacterium]
MNRTGAVLVLAPWLISAAFAQPAVPPGGAARGYTKCVIDERPNVADIAPGKNGDFRWFSGRGTTATRRPRLT